MLNRIKIIAKYYAFWIAFFVAIRAFFLLYNYQYTSNLSVSTIFLTFWHGLALDLSMAGYLLILVVPVMAASFFASEKFTRYFLGTYTLFFLVIASIIGICDCELYRNWGFRMDSTVLLYLKTPKEAAASTPVWLSLLFVLWIIGWVLLCWKGYKKFIEPNVYSLKPTKWTATPLLLFVAALFVIPIRGGFGMPIRTGSVYFSSETFANHAAINVQWNFCNSIVDAKEKVELNFMPNNNASNIVNNLYNDNTTKPEQIQLNCSKPNILMIILESFTAKAVGCLNGENATPNLDSIAQSGVLFTNFFGNSDRSDKGLVCILSGYPAQPTTSIMKYTDKAQKLPHLSIALNDLGYHSAFYYGGDIDFANLKSYCVTGKYSRIVSKSNFARNEMNSKWGAQDHFVFNRLLTDLNAEQSPWFNVFFTLSSHEPFDVPMQSQFNQNTEDSKFLNSVCYTDSCLGAFMRTARTQTWWDSTLVVLVADHGSRLPHNTPATNPRKFHIPLVLTGGALQSSGIQIDALSNQTDIPLLIGHLLNQQFNQFTYSKSINNSNNWAMYVYNNGFAFMRDSAFVVYDIAGNKTLVEQNVTDSLLTQGKAMVQSIVSDFNGK
ncbi:MAG: sulfatase-like hydrolase/transferase [Salinivirgaceae bacterium]|nr:sulfatase-like hydrolase/transferase [Salinivirgaceae bacterium]